MSRTSHTRAIDAATEQAHSLAPKRTRHFPPVITLRPTLLKNSKGEVRMKSLRLTCIIAMTLLAVAMPVSLAAQDRTQPQHQYHHYQLIDVGTFGGPQSNQYIYAPARGVLNNSGALGGWADTSTIDPLCFFDYPDCNAAHAFLWQNGAKTDLGVLPGGLNSQANWISANGLIAGAADNGQMDLLQGIPQLRGTFWGHDGCITDVGTLPGAYFAF